MFGRRRWRAVPRSPYRPTVKPWKEESFRLRLSAFREHLAREAAERAEAARGEDAQRRLDEIEREVEANPMSQRARDLRRWRLR